jgi:hypothetical protein
MDTEWDGAELLPEAIGDNGFVPKWLWTQREDVGPSPRRSYAMAFDAARGVVVLFGGYRPLAQPSMLNDTWQWDGSSWTQVENSGPSPRNGHAMVYDSARDRIVLFGGASGSQFGDTWEWDGSSWHQVADTGPRARAGHAMAFDPGRGRTVLFGGPDPNLGAGFADPGTWEWDGVGWLEVADIGPSPRSYSVMGYLSGPNATAIFGGTLAAGIVADTWHWNGSLWTQVSDIGPQARSLSALAGVGASAVLFGGLAAPTYLNDTWEWNGTFWTQRQDMGPPPRSRHSLAFDSIRNRLVLFGGVGVSTSPTDPVGLLGDTWELALD